MKVITEDKEQSDQGETCVKTLHIDQGETCVKTLHIDQGKTCVKTLHIDTNNNTHPETVRPETPDTQHIDTKSEISETDRLELSFVTIMSQMQTSLSNNTKKILDSNGKIQEFIKSLPMNKVKTKDTDDQSSQINSLKSQNEQLKTTSL